MSFISSLPPLFLISLIFLSLSNGDSQFQYLPIKQIQLGKNNKEYHVLRIRGIERIILEEKSTQNETAILAANETLRKDPLDNFNYYTGGWDYKNTHYWASVSFSAAPLFIIGAVWFLILGFFFICYCLCCCCCRKKTYGYSRVAYALSLVFLIIFTIVAFTGCVVLYTNQENFHKSVTETLEYIMQRAISIFDNFMDIMEALMHAKSVTVNQISLPADLQTQIDLVERMVNATASLPQLQSTANSQLIARVLDPSRLTLNIIAALMLTLAFLGFLFSVCGIQCLVCILVIIGWILITMTFILCGVFLVFHNVVDDTCVAMGDWLQHPRTNSQINVQFLPCMDHATAEQTFNTTKQTTSYIITMVNEYVGNVANKNLTPEAGLVYYNQSGPLVPLLCNPYNPDMTARICAPEEVDFSTMPQEWRKHICEATSSNICINVGRLTSSSYDQLTAYVNISYSLYRSRQFLVDLGDCTFVLETFNDINRFYCPKLRVYSYWTYVGLVMVSASVMCSVIFWILYSRERRHRKYTKKLMARSKLDNPFAGRTV